MAKRIFKVIGIVLASIVGFTGCVIGVLAIMGKFKKPVVYPKQLFFADTEMVVNDNNVYTDNLSETLYNFELKGISDEEHEVTEKNCLLTINMGSNLIQLCNSEGEAITPETNGKYKIQCNEKTYFKLKKIEDKLFTDSTFGKVTFRADDERMMTGTARNQDLVVWIDRKVETIKIDDSQVGAGNVNDTYENGLKVREITLGLDEGLAFDAVSTPSYALNPISRDGYSGKIVEFFYFKPGAMTDWAMIDKNDLTAYPFLTYDSINDKIYFRASTTDLAGQTYCFRLAVFATYAEREQFLANLENASTDMTNVERMANMVWSQFNIIVKSTKITSIGSESSNVSLSLFEKTNNVVLSSADKENYQNLGIYMIGAGTRTTLRFDEADFDLRTINLIKDANVEDMWFKSYTASEFAMDNSLTLNLTTKVGNTFLDFFVYNNKVGDPNYQSYRLATKSEFDYIATYEKGTIGANRSFNISVKTLPKLDDDMQLVLGVMVVNNSGEYYITSVNANVAEKELNFDFVNETQTHTLNISYLKSNSANDYYVQADSLHFADIASINAGSYRACVFVTPVAETNNYDIEVIGNIKFVKDGQTYVLVGYFNGNKFVNQVKAKVGATNKDTKLYVLQLKNTYATNFGDEDYDSAEKYINSIVSSNIEAEYNISTELTGDNTILLNKDFISTSRMVVVNTNYNIDDVADVISFKGFNNGTREDIVSEDLNSVQLVAGFEYTVKLTSPVGNEMLANIFYANASSFKQCFSVAVFDRTGNQVDDDLMFSILDVAPDASTVPGEGETYAESTENQSTEQSKDLIIKFSVNENADSTSSATPHTYKLVFKFGQVEVSSNPISVESNRPTNVTLSYIEGAETEQPTDPSEETPEQPIDVSSQDDEESDTPQQKQIDIELNNATLYIEIGMAGDATNYSYKYKLQYTYNGASKEYIYNDNEFKLNTANEALTTVPVFHLSPNYREENVINYSIAGNSVTNLENLAVGEYVLSVTSYGNLSKNLNVVVTATVNPVTTTTNYFTYNTASEKEVKDKTNFNLNKEAIEYKYVESGEGVELPALVNISNVRFNFSGSENLELIFNETENTYILQTKNEIESARKQVLILSRNATDGDWTFERTDFLNTRLVITLNISMDTIQSYDLTIAFTSSRQIDLNKNWTNIYADTKINFYEQSQTGEFTTNALFKITDSSSSALSFDIFRTDDTTDSTNYGENFDESGSKSLPAGTYRIVFKTSNGETLASFENISVKPNVFAVLENGTLTTDTDNIRLTDILKLQQYNTDRVYGQNGGTNEIYSSTDLVPISNFDNFTIQCNEYADKLPAESAQTALVSLTNGILSVGYLKDLNAQINCTLVLKYSGSIIESFDVLVINKFEVNNQIKNEIMVNHDNLLDGLTVKDSTSAEASSKYPTSVDILTDGFTLSGSNIIEQNISSATTITAVYTFDIDGKPYTYTTQLKLIPYIPTLKGDAGETETYSQNNTFDIINDVFDLTYNDNIITDTNIKNIYVEKVLVDGQEDYSFFVDGQSVKGIGYKADTTGSSFVTAIGKIIGGKQTVVIVYHIDYDETHSSEYAHTLVINNKYSIESQYPFNDLANETYTKTTTDINLVAVDGKVEDVKNFGEYTDKGNNIFAFKTGLKYEPVTMQQVVDFNTDGSLDIRRASITDLTTDAPVTNSIEKVELIGFESNQNARFYANGGYISIENSIVTFGASVSFSAGASAYFLFKITTTTGNYCYYLVRLHKQTGDFAGLETADFAQEFDSDQTTINIIPSYATINTNCKLTLANANNLNFYLLSIKTSENISAVDGFDASLIGVDVNQYDKLNLTNGEYTITNPNKFVQIKVGIVYADANKVLFLGTYTTNIAVSSNLNLYNQSTQEGLLHKTGSLGHYTATLPDLTEQNIIKAVATANVEINSVTITSANAGYLDVSSNNISTIDDAPITDIVMLNGAKITPQTYLTSNLTFTVCYKIDGAIIYVDYTFAGVTVDQISDVVLGDFDKSTGFNSTLNLSNRVGNYVGAIEYNYTNSSLPDSSGTLPANKTINFNQTNSTQVKRVTLTLSQLFDLAGHSIVQRAFNVTLYPAYYIEQGNNGGLVSSPYQAIKNETNQFNSAVGSFANIAKTETVIDSTTYVTYTVGGLSVYAPQDVVLEYSSLDNLYIVANSNDGTLLGASETVEIDSDGSPINFVHMAQNKTIKLVIKLKNGTGYLQDKNDSDKNLTIDFNVTLPATYVNLEAIYTVKGSNHDNFVAGTTQTGILSYFFSGETGENYSTKRMQLVYQNKLADGSFEDKTTFEFNAGLMGFISENNPNKINLNLGEALSKTVNGNDYDINFNNVSADTQTWIKLKNDAGLEGAVYSLNIMLNEKDKLVYTPDGDENQYYIENHSAWAVGGGSQYASVLINDGDNSIDYKYSTVSNQTKIAKIYDVRNNVLKLNATVTVTYGSSSTATGSLTLQTDENGLEKYSATVAGYTITIYRTTNREIMFDVERKSGEDLCKNIIVTIDIYTNAGLICEGFKLNIFNYNVSATSTSWYATEQIALNDLFSVACNDGSTATGLTYDLDLQNGNTYYYVNGEKVVVNNNSNKLFEYNSTTKTLITYQVPEQVQLTISVKIKLGDVLITTAKRVVIIERNIQFKVNGESVAPGSQFETTYELGASGHYSISANKVQINDYNLTTDLSMTYVKTDQVITMGNDNCAIAVSQVEVADYTGNNIANYVSFDAGTKVLTFLRDFSGAITLRLGYKTNSGYFYQYWTINVVALNTLTYLNSPTTAKVDNGSPYESGKLVNIVDINENDNPAIKVTTSIQGGSNIKYNVKLRYKILSVDEFNTVDMDYLLNLTDGGMVEDLTNDQATTLAISRSLPIVPQSKQDNPVDYYVVYKISYTYIVGDVTSQPYFTIYKVRNVASVTLAQGVSTDINVDNSSTIYDSTTKYLKLFYYEEIYGATSVKYAGNKNVYINNTVYPYTENNNVLTVNVSGAQYVFDYNVATPTLTILTINSGEPVERTSTTTYYNSMYNCEYVNLLRFIDFVNSITKITINDCEFNKDKLSVAEGLIYITLTNRSSTETYLFTNTAQTQIKIFVNDNTVPMQADDITLSGNKSITPKGTLWLSQIFQNGGYGTDYKIVGIYSSSINATWVNNASNVTQEANPISQFTIVGTPYSVYQITFTGAAVAGLYQVSADYYALQGADEIYAVDYRSKGESNCFRVKYEEGKDSVIDMTDAIKKYYNVYGGSDAGKLMPGEVTLGGISVESPLSLDGSKCKITEDELITLKQNNKDISSISYTVTLTYNLNLTLDAVIKFDLPELTYSVDAPAGSETEVKFNLSQLDGNFANFRNVTVYDQTNGVYLDVSTNNIIMAKTELTNYKTENSDAEYMKVNYLLTYTTVNASGEDEQVSVSFAVRWKLS